MACKLYISNGNNDTYIGTFPTRAKAETHYNTIKRDIKQLYGYKVKSIPIYVETGKGRGYK